MALRIPHDSARIGQPSTGPYLFKKDYPMQLRQTHAWTKMARHCRALTRKLRFKTSATRSASASGLCAEVQYVLVVQGPEPRHAFGSGDRSRSGHGPPIRKIDHGVPIPFCPAFNCCRSCEWPIAVASRVEQLSELVMHRQATILSHESASPFGAALCRSCS